MIKAQEVLWFHHLLSENGIPVWMVGGWGLDALLGEQTRPHKDIDVLVRFVDLQRLRNILADQGFTLKELWSENINVLDEQGSETPTAFVLRDVAGREMDIHALYQDERGNYLPAWQDDENRVYQPADLAGEGVIGGEPVACISAEMQIISHTGYTLPDYQVRDLANLRHKFRLE